MTEGKLREDEFVASLRSAFPASPIGDDAAVDPGDGQTLLATDTMVEEIHFNRLYCNLSQPVQKLVTSNVSDIYAMGGAPRSVLFTAGLSKGFDREDMEDLIAGLRLACDYYGVGLVGGDTVSSPKATFLSMAITGSLEGRRPLERRGARPGDSIFLFGECGGSNGGLMMIDVMHVAQVFSPEKPTRNLPAWDQIEPLIWSLSLESDEAEIAAFCEGRPEYWKTVLSLIKRFLVPAARPLPTELLTSGALTAAIDVSDGIARDLRRLCSESGVGAELDERAFTLPKPFTDLFEFTQEAIVEFVLGSGEEYVILATGDLPEPPPGATKIGTVLPAGEGLVIRGPDGKLREMPMLGYEHEF